VDQGAQAGGRGGFEAEMREEEGRVKGTGMGRVVGWNRRARVNYVHCRTSKGNPQAWRHKLDDSVDPEFRKCGRYAEAGKHAP